MTSTIKVDTIQNSAGTTGLTIDSSGFVLPKVPAFQVFLTSNQTVTSNTYTKVDWATYGSVQLDNTSAWDSSNNRWIPQAAGWYNVFGQIVGGTGTIRATLVRILKNTGVVSQSMVYLTGDYGDDLAATTSLLVYLNGSTDYIEMHGLVRDQSASTDVYFGTSDPVLTLFGAHFVTTG